MFSSSAFVLAFAIASIAFFAMLFYESYKEVIEKDEEER